jgi:DNA-binding NarL/FixJ family response regulator
MNRRIRIMVVSAHPILSDGLRMACSRTTDAEIVCETLDIGQVAGDFAQCRPDVAIVDLQLTFARRAIRLLQGLCSYMPILVLTTASKPASSTDRGGKPLLEVSKNCRSDVIVDAARSAALGAETNIR